MRDDGVVKGAVTAGSALQISGLQKRFGATVAVDDVGFAVPAGAILTLLGLRLAAPRTAARLPEILTAVSKG